MFYGQNTNSATTSIIVVLECQAQYMASAVRVEKEIEITR